MLAGRRTVRGSARFARAGQLSVILLDWLPPKATSSPSRTRLRREGSRAILCKGAWDGFIDDGRVGCVCGHFFYFKVPDMRPRKLGLKMSSKEKQT
jgi:hypothetical protein